MDPYYSVPTLGNLWFYVKQGSWLDTWTFWHLVILCSMPIDVVCGHLKHTKKCFVTKLYVYSIHCVKLLSKHPEANFKHILGMQFAVDVIFVVLSSLNNDLIIYVFATVVGCEITYKGCTELNNVPYISAKVTCTINFGDKETRMFSVVEGSKCITYNDHFFDKKRQAWKQQIFQKSILEYTVIYVLWYFRTMWWWHHHISSLIFSLIWVMTKIILCMQKSLVFVLRLFWLVLIQ